MVDLTQSGAYSGREVFVEVALDGSQTVPADAEFLDIGGTKELNLSGQWGTIDLTNRSSLNRIREELLDYIGFSGSVSGNVLADAESNIRELRNRTYGIVTDDDASQVAPTGWIRFTIPDQDGAAAGDTEILTLPVNFSQCELAWPDEGAATFNVQYTGRGLLRSTVVPFVAPTP